MQYNGKQIHSGMDEPNSGYAKTIALLLPHPSIKDEKLLSININVFAANDDASGYNETLYSNAIGLVNALNVGVSANVSNIDSDITRIELLRNAYQLLNNGAQLGSGTQDKLALTDVAEGDMGYLEFAAYCGIINYKDKYFYPNEAADFEFAERTLLCLISYYNDNTSNQFLKTDLTKGLRSSAMSNFKAGDAYVMIYNLLISDNPFGLFGQAPILKGLYGLEKAKVRVIGDSLSAYSGLATEEGKVRVEFSNGAVEDLSYSGDSKDLLGRYAYIYYNATEGYITFMTEYRGGDIIAEITEKTFSSLDINKRKIYWKEFKSSNRWESSYVERHATVSKTADIIYNGVFVSDQNFVYDILANNTANIDNMQLISIDNSDEVNLIKIDAYTTAYVQNVSSDQYVIIDKSSGRRFILDPDRDNNNISVVNTNGETVAFDNIAANSVISIFDITSARPGYKLIVSTAKTDGTVSTLKEDENRCSIVADGVEYMFANGLSEYADAIKINTSYILYMDHNGLVAGYEYGTLALENVGGVISMSFNENENNFEFRIYTITGEVKEFKTRDGFKVNGTKTTLNEGYTINVVNDDDVQTQMTFGEFRNYVQKGLIQFKLDGDRKIREIILPRKNAKPGNIGYPLGMNNPDIPLSNPASGNLRYKTNLKSFIPTEYTNDCKNFAAIDSNTQIIKIPSAIVDVNREQYYSLVSLGSLKNDNKLSVVAYTFEGENAAVADIVALVTGSSSSGLSTDMYLVKKIVTCVNNEGEVGKMLKCINAASGSEVEFTTESEQFAEYGTSNYVEIGKGDIIKLATNVYQDASSFQVVYDCSTGKAIEENVNRWYSEQRLVLGSVYNVSDSHFTYVHGGEMNLSGDEAMQIGSAKSVITVEKRENGEDYDINVGKMSSLVGYTEDPVNYSRVIYVTTYGEPRACVVYK